MMTALPFHEGEFGMWDCNDKIFSQFSSQPVDDTIERIEELEVEPFVALRENARTISFKLEPIADFVLIKETKIELDLQVTDSAGQDIDPPRAANAEANPPVTAYASCGFDQMPSSSIIRTVDVRLNDTSVSSNDLHYAESAYILAILGMDKNSLDSKFEVAGFFMESNPDDTDMLKPGSGFMKRGKKSNGSDVYKVSSAIWSPLFCQPKAMLPMVKLSVTFQLHEPNFVLKSGVAGGTFDYKIKGAKLIFQRLKVISL